MTTAIFNQFAAYNRWANAWLYSAALALPDEAYRRPVGDPLPQPVQQFREQIATADGLVIVSSEYNHGIPGVLKNALDWASRPHNSSPLRNKPVLIVTSSPAVTGGVRAQYQIRETVISALARPLNTPEIVVGQVHLKIVDGRFEDPAVIEFARSGFAALFAEIDRFAGLVRAPALAAH